MELLILIGAVLVLMLFMTSSGRKRQQVAFAALRESLEPGDEVIVGGMIGKFVEMDAERITVEVAPGVNSQWMVSALRGRISPPLADDDLDGSATEPDQNDDPR
jgi:preprotein translocase YajC subunit